MTAPLAHTPYDGSAEPFTIGLKVLDPADWIELDDDFGRYAAEKERHWAENRSAVFVETISSRPAQQEVLAMLAKHLPARFPGAYAPSQNRMRLPDGRQIDLGEEVTPALFRAARMVQEDLVVMEKAQDGWRLTAASLSFPSSWSLREKFDRPMHAIHETVPGFHAGTRNAELIERMFTNLRPERPVWRLNWSIYPDADLYHAKSKVERSEDFVGPLDPASTFIRVERQTLRRLPETGAILFTIRIYVDPLTALIAHGAGAELAEGLARQLAGLGENELAYKGLSRKREALVEALERVREAAEKQSGALL